VMDEPRFLASLSVQAKIQAGSESPKNCSLASAYSIQK
jgi:hypothetical protein